MGSRQVTEHPLISVFQFSWLPSRPIAYTEKEQRWLHSAVTCQEAAFALHLTFLEPFDCNFCLFCSLIGCQMEVRLWPLQCVKQQHLCR